MLANSFMTPSALGISEVEFNSLVKVLGMLERSEIPDDLFTMRRVQHSCRTPACICGWANYVSAGRAFPLYAKPGLTVFSDRTFAPRWGRSPAAGLELFAHGGRPGDVRFMTRPLAQAAMALAAFSPEVRASLAESSARGITRARARAGRGAKP
jgi:hypothetical protein